MTDPTQPDARSDHLLELDKLELTVLVDNETDTLSSTDAVEQSAEGVGHLDRREPSYVVDGHDHTSVFDHLCCACHGYSVMLTGTAGETSRSILFDVGPYAEIWLGNAARLSVDLSTIEVIFLSHWHWDHSGGMVPAIEAIAKARSEAGLAPVVVDVHPDRPDQRGIKLADERVMLLPPDPTLEELTAAGATVRASSVDHTVAGGFFLGSGEIERHTTFETGLQGHQTRRNQAFEPDPLLLDERYLAVTVKGRGVSVLSACSHAGIINAATAAMQATDAPLDLVLGGYHLAGGEMEERIPETVNALVDLNPKLVAPGHCTGWRAKAELANVFAATGRYAPSVVGTTYTLHGR